MSDYPKKPGDRGIDTSVAAGESIAEDVHAIRAKALHFVRSQGAYGATSDEVAVALEMENPYSSRPRLSELRALRKIADSGHRRKNLSGRSAIVWVTHDLAENLAEAA